MAGLRFKCPSVNGSVLSSELAEETYQKNLLPVRDDLFSAAEVLDCDGDGERRKTLALEVLTKCIQVVDSDNNLAMDVDISYPTWIAEKLMLQLLPEPLVSYASDGGGVPILPVRACAWFEDDTSTNDSGTYKSGGLCPMAQDTELDVEDVLCKPIVQSKKLLVDLSSPVDSGVDEDFKKLKVQDIEPISSTITSSEETKLQKSIRGLDDTISQTSSEADCGIGVKPFDTKACDGGMWNFPEIPDSQNVEPCATPMVQNPKADEYEDLSDDLSCLLDGLGPTPSILEEQYAPDLGIATQSPQQSGTCSVSTGNTFLVEDSSIDSSIQAMKPLQIQNMPEKLKIVKSDRFEQSSSSRHRSCDPGVKNTSDSVMFVDLTCAEDSSLRGWMAHGNEENSGIRHQEHRLPIGTGALVSTSELTYESSPCSAGKDDSSDHPTLSEEKTTCSTAPPPYIFTFDSTRSVSDRSIINETHACRELTSQKQSSGANPKNFALRQNSTRQEKTRLALEAIHQQRGSTSFTTPSFAGMPREVTAPPSPASAAPLEHLKCEELRSDKCLGSRDVKMMKKQPLVIVAANVMQPDGPVLPQRRSSYQRILALENEQLQIVERECHLPVDLILSPSTCLIVYTAATMKLNWEKNPGVASKECSAFIADILVNCQMKAMSFSFEKCFMVFEGESTFSSFILQATPKLAVAAAGFGMQVQCFVSSSPRCTEDIALMCIERIRKKAKRPYPSPMSECENDDELFLEQFPSINPLAAHAILSLNVPLSKFMLWSHDAMANALQDFEVPIESLKLLKLQSEHRKLKEGQGPRNTYPEETYPGGFPFLPPASSEFDDFETEFNVGRVSSDYRNSFCPSLDRIFEIDPLGDGPSTSDKHNAFGLPFGPAFQMDPKFIEDFTAERCFNFWDDPYHLSEQEHLPVKPWPEEGPIQRPITQRDSNRSQKPGYIQTCLDDWIETIEQGKSDPKRTWPEPDLEFLDLTKAAIPSQTRQQDLFPTLNFEMPGREKVQSATINITPAKRAASALDHQKGISRPQQKKRKSLSRPQQKKRKSLSLPQQKKRKSLSRPHLRSAVVEISSVQAAQAHLPKRFCFNNPSRFSRSS